MRSSDRFEYAQLMAKPAMARTILRAGTKVAPNLLRNAWSNMGLGAKLGLGALGAGGLYGGYRMLKPNTSGMMGQISQNQQNQVNDLNQIMGGFVGRR